MGGSLGRGLPGEVDLGTVKRIVIAIDGPAASGKSSVARLLADRLELPFLNTGAMYRAVGLACAQAGADPVDEPVCRSIAKDQVFDLDSGGRLLWNGKGAEALVGGEEAGAMASQIALLPGVREVLVLRQRELGQRYGAVAEGRDTTTVVFPCADHKFFLWASAGVRGKRRAAQDGAPERAEAITAEIECRDAQDTGRAIAPLLQAEDAVRVDTDGLDLEAVVERLIDHIGAASA